MFSRERSFHPKEDNSQDFLVFIEESFKKFIDASNLCSGFFCIWDDDLNDVIPLVAVGIPIAPFKGSRKESLQSYIEECLTKHPTPHIHSVVREKLWEEISSLTDISKWQNKSLFIPAYIADLDFIAICFSENEEPFKNIEDTINNLTEVIEVSNFILSADSMKNRVNVMEIYVREIGHDIASSVQATIAKLRNVSRGLIQGPAAIKKIKEAEEEIMATYRIADTLGITVDPDYNIGSGTDFNALDIIQDVIQLCQSEAAERHIELRMETKDQDIGLWGDQKAIQSALMQLVMNAIKYAKGSSYVTIRSSQSHENVEFNVTNRGLSLSSEDKNNVWDFGWRGAIAKEFHVNGSGIGLYTVKKIVKAHGGSVSLNISGDNSDVITFIFRIPKKEHLKKYFVNLRNQ